MIKPDNTLLLFYRDNYHYKDNFEIYFRDSYIDFPLSRAQPYFVPMTSSLHMYTYRKQKQSSHLIVQCACLHIVFISHGEIKYNER